MLKLKKIDILFFSYVLITTILLLFSWNDIDNSTELLTTRIVIILMSFGLIFWHSKSNLKFVKLVRNAYPIVFATNFYPETFFYNKLFFNNLDSYFIKMDAWLFGFQPSVWFSEYFSNPIFSELMYFGYFYLYVLIIGFVFIVFFKLKNDIDELYFKLAAAMLLYYLFFCFFPASGPQFYFPSPEKNVPSAFLFDKIMHFLQEAEQPTGAFPSSHVGLSIIILVLLRKKSILFYKISLPIVFLLILSTVYIKAHYFVDIIGGFISIPIMFWLSNFLYRKISIKETRKKNNF